MLIKCPFCGCVFVEEDATHKTTESCFCPSCDGELIIGTGGDIDIMENDSCVIKADDLYHDDEMFCPICRELFAFADATECPECHRYLCPSCIENDMPCICELNDSAIDYETYED